MDGVSADSRTLRFLAAVVGTGGVLCMAASFSFTGFVEQPVPRVFGFAGAVNCLLAALLLGVARRRLGDAVELHDPDCLPCREAPLLWCGGEDDTKAAGGCGYQPPEPRQVPGGHPTESSR